MLSFSKSYHYLKSCICFLLIFVWHNQYAQTDLFFDAQRLCNEKKFDEALPIIEKIIIHPETKMILHPGTFVHLLIFKLSNNLYFQQLIKSIY